MSPFRVRRVGSVLELALDTPDASVNVFGPAAALQLDGILTKPPQGVTTLLLRSEKLGSFINGAGLLYANAMRSVEGALSVSAPVRGVYERLAGSPLRTVAFVEGNCFGCGLELAVACDVVIARDTAETKFRMTEVTDYRFVPLFGGTWRLPRRVGTESAARLLLDGERWDARAARARGLVDHVVEADVSDRAVMALVAGASRRRVRATATSGPRARRNVPPTRAALWRDVEDLLHGGARGAPEACRDREVNAFATTVTAAPAKNAMSFFFVRHTARTASFGTADRIAPRVRLRIATSGATARARARWMRLFRAPTAVAPTKESVLTVLSERVARAGGILLAFPHGLSAGICEISASRADLERARAIGQALVWRGIETILTLRPGDLVSHLLLERTRRALGRLLASGTTAATINRALWDLGFEEPFRFRAWPRTRARSASVAARKDAIELIASTWTATLDEARGRGALLHASQGDVLIHSLFGFPLELGSFSRWSG